MNSAEHPKRTPEQLRHHYEVEKSLAGQLRCATRDERRTLYPTLYDELFRLVPDHPRHINPSDHAIHASVRNKLRVVAPFLRSAMTVVEFAPGNGTFSYELCKHVSFVYGVDISDQRIDRTSPPPNFQMLTFDGYSAPLPFASADLAFSDQLIEHIHPDDISLHFEMVRNILKPGGAYLFRTPHRFSGPHDISKYFSDTAEGFHFKEWTYKEIRDALFTAGYTSFTPIQELHGKVYTPPFLFFRLLEGVLSNTPHIIRHKLAARILNQVAGIAWKTS